MQEKRRYSEDFKRDAIRLLETSGKRLSQIEQELLSQGIRTSIKRVARLLREAGLQGKMPRRKHPRTTQTDDTYPVAPNLLNRQFSGRKRHEVWLTDMTYIEMTEGYLYVAGVLDLGSREVVGLALADHMRTE